MFRQTTRGVTRAPNILPEVSNDSWLHSVARTSGELHYLGRLPRPSATSRWRGYYSCDWPRPHCRPASSTRRVGGYLIASDRPARYGTGVDHRLKGHIVVRRHTVGTGIAIAILGLSLGIASPAPALRNGYYAYDPNQGTINQVNFQRCSLTSAVLAAANWSDTYNLEPLDMYTAIYTCDTTDNYAREVNIFDGLYGDVGWAARWRCVIYLGEGACAAGEILVRTDQVNSSTATNYNNAVLCHEHGHSVGLAHVSSSISSCMVNPATGTKRFYTDAEKSELNAIY